MMRAVALLCLIVFAAFSGRAAQVTVTDNSSSTVLSSVIGSGVLTQVRVAWPSFTSNDGTSVAAGSILLNASSGFSVSLVTNAGLSPAVFYTFTFYIQPTSGNLQIYSALVILPASGTVGLSGCTISAPWYNSPGNNTGGGGGDVGLLKGATVINVPLIHDGTCAVQSPSVLVSGALPGSPVFVGATPKMPDGFVVAGAVDNAGNSVFVTICNQSGKDQTPGTASFTVAVSQ